MAGRRGSAGKKSGASGRRLRDGFARGAGGARSDQEAHAAVGTGASAACTAGAAGPASADGAGAAAGGSGCALAVMPPALPAAAKAGGAAAGAGDNACLLERRKRAELLAESGDKVVGVCWHTSARRWTVCSPKIRGKRTHLGSFVTKADAIERRLRYDDERKSAQKENQKQTPAQRKQRPSESSGAVTRRPSKRRRTSTTRPSGQQQGAGRSRHDGAEAPHSEAQGASCSEIRKRAELLAAAKGAKGRRAPRVPGVSWHSVAKGWTVYVMASIAHGKMTQLHLGYFQTKADAIERRLRYDAARKGKQKQTPAQRKGSPAEAMSEATRQRNNRQLTTTPAAPPALDVGTPDQGGQIFKTQSGTRDVDAYMERE